MNTCAECVLWTGELAYGYCSLKDIQKWGHTKACKHLVLCYYDSLNLDCDAADQELTVYKCSE